MNLQEAIALGIVGVTVGCFAWKQFGRRKTRPAGCCGCPAAGAAGSPGGLLLKARKNEPVRILLK